jgi:hypothetical protein
MCAHRDPSKIPRWEVLSGKCASCIVRGYISTSSAFVESQSSSQSSGRSLSNSERVDLPVIDLSSKRKAASSPMISQRPQKIARTDTSHHPGMPVKETEATSRTQHTFESRSTTASLISTIRKRKKVLLPRNREAQHPLFAHLTGTFTILEYHRRVAVDIFLSPVNSRQNGNLSRPRNIGLGSEGELFYASNHKVKAENGHIYSKILEYDPREIVWRLLSYYQMLIPHLPAMQVTPSSSTATTRQTNETPPFIRY